MTPAHASRVPSVRLFVFCFLLSVFCLLLSPSALAAPQPTLNASLNYSALHPGQQAAIALTVAIPVGLHSQSNTPTDATFIPFLITPAPVDAVTFLPIQYPAGRDVNYPALGPLSIYDGTVTAYLPLTVSPTAAPGPLTLAGKLQIQLCNDEACFAPFRGKKALPFALDVEIVPATQTVTLTNADLFTGFDPRIFAAGAAKAPPTTTTPAAPSATTAAATPAATPAPAAPAEIQLFGWRFQLAQSAYALAFSLAFAVGIIFNLMPCVLPVVPLKAIGFYEASRHNRAQCLLLGIIFSLGLLSVFAVLAGLVIVGGAAWGELFAKSWFVWSIVAILVIMSLGQLGAYSVLLPNSLYSFVPTHSSYLGNYLFGGFTAILSTPCTAPMFVGLLLWAAGQPKTLGVAIMLTVGLGMAFPYLLLAAYPELARKIPRTGAWSELLKQFMAFLLLAVAAYFAAGRLISGNGCLWIVFAIVLLGCLFLVGRTWQLSRTPRALVTSTLIALLLSGGTFYFARTLTAAAAHDAIPWQAYSTQKLADALAQNRIVMLEFTANWCANCKELESRVFTNPRTTQALADLNVLPLRADLTLDDAPGWDKLREISKSGGIPLTLIYSPSHGAPVMLSSIYTTDNLLAALTAAQ